MAMTVAAIVDLRIIHCAQAAFMGACHRAMADHGRGFLLDTGMPGVILIRP